MGIKFEWDPNKAAKNFQKHRVSFEEAATVFRDTLSITTFDPDHSIDEDRYITVGLSIRTRLLMVAHTDREDCIRIISARKLTRKERIQKKEKEAGSDDELRPEYDLTELFRGGVKGKYAQRYEEGVNLVLLAPDVASAFPDEEAVNEALRIVLQLANIPTMAPERRASSPSAP